MLFSILFRSKVGTLACILCLISGFETCRGERARAVTAVFGSLDLGSAIGLLICGPLINAFGWPSVFYLFALLGLAWAAAWPLLRPEDPDPAVRRGSSPAPAAGPKGARPHCSHRFGTGGPGGALGNDFLGLPA